MTGAPSPATSPLLHATSLERRFGAARVLRGISLTVSPGECHLIVGPNGAGKSTLLRILAGLARPNGGAVSLRGTVPGREPASRRAVGLLSHQSHLYDDLSAAENLAFAARLHGMPDPEGAARDRLAALGLLERADEPVRRLSRGLLQRVAIARALLHEPTLLLLDEPFTGLDPHATSQVTTMLRAELQRGAAVVLVSHEVREAWPLATHAYALIRGEWALAGPVAGSADQFLARYREAMDG
ncbi:MAG TPA: heme ABC exporter ATP-binding protein CcmA [Gemmatimonadales bacterium]|nr:heme ABC exporter ATP-binding protein CcmA [Gemmatimonadales bacterium]